MPILFFLLLNINKQKLYEEAHDLSQRILSLNLGFSSYFNLLDADEWSEIGNSRKIVGLLTSVPKIIHYKLFQKNKFVQISININFLNYLTLLEDRENALNNGILTSPKEVNANIIYMGEPYKAKVRLKGDFADHWNSRHRMSLRVKLKNDKTILGFSRFSIQKPSTRVHPYDSTFQSLVKDSGNISSSHKFAQVIVNGEDWGIMNIEEHISKELLEKQNKKESIVVKFGSGEKWLYQNTSNIPYKEYKLSDSIIYSHLYNEKSLKEELNRKMYSYVKNNRLLTNNIYDNDSFSQALILSLVWGSSHVLEDHNIKYYFNPFTLILEPIILDQEKWSKLDENSPNFFQQDWFDSGMATYSYKQILSSKKFIERLPINLAIVKKSLSNFDKHLLYNESLFPVDKKRKEKKVIQDNMDILLNNAGRYIVDSVNSFNLSTKSNQQITIMPVLPSMQQASEFKQHIHFVHYSDGTLKLYNLIPEDVIVKNVLFNGNPIPIQETLIPGYLSNPKPTIIKTAFIGIQDEMFTISTEYKGFNATSKNYITVLLDDINNPLLLDTGNEFEFIEAIDENVYEVKVGSWTIDKPIILDGDLIILPGTNLEFEKNTYIIIKGSLTAIGEESNPITLKSKIDYWDGLYVVNANKKSYIKNVNISNTSSIDDGLLNLSGSITFYKSDAELENVRINNVKAEDAINIVNSTFSLDSIFIKNTFSDGLDSDFSSGKVLNSMFSNIGGDALDFSGSNVVITDTSASNVQDKAVSAGEGSELNIENSHFNNIGIGVASKDGSSVILSNSSIFDSKLYSTMSYIKKDFYEPPKIIIINTNMSKSNAHIRQKGTYMLVDGTEIPESEINVDKIYNLGKE
ncbi:MAG: hypothetical protein HOI39_08010 [Flavobacteriales bacterium]|nr:hypothetical protein [Flavobacteriales bacterium]